MDESDLPAWKRYQEDVAAFMRELGFEAATDVRIQGARTTHDIDVLVKGRRFGFEFTWIVECKHWQAPVSKLHVLGLRQIVIDVGADRGILMCESGFQSGAAEAAVMTNVQLRDLAELRTDTRHDVNALRLRDLFDRTSAARDLYWEIPKAVRIAMDLRQEYADWYSGTLVLQFADGVLGKALRNVYPINDVFLPGAQGPTFPVFTSAEDVISTLEPLLTILEGKLKACYAVKDRWSEISQRRG